MAQEFGIASISGVAIANVGKRSAVVKANMWSTSGQQRQASLFKTLSENGNWANYTQGKNSASFNATSVTGVICAVYFSVPNHIQGTTYNFSFTKNATISGKTWFLSASPNASFTGSGTTSVGLTNAAGAVNAPLTSSAPSGAIFMGILFSNLTQTDTIRVTDLIVT